MLTSRSLQPFDTAGPVTLWPTWTPKNAFTVLVINEAINAAIVEMWPQKPVPGMLNELVLADALLAIRRVFAAFKASQPYQGETTGASAPLSPFRALTVQTFASAGTPSGSRCWPTCS